MVRPTFAAAARWRGFGLVAGHHGFRDVACINGETARQCLQRSAVTVTAISVDAGMHVYAQGVTKPRCFKSRQDCTQEDGVVELTATQRNAVVL